MQPQPCAATNMVLIVVLLSRPVLLSLMSYIRQCQCVLNLLHLIDPGSLWHWSHWNLAKKCC
jgi:hypothetical protein